MVRTKAHRGGGAFRKVLGARAPRKMPSAGDFNAGPAPAARRGPRRRAMLNAVCVRPVPAWQRSIGEFLQPPAESRGPPVAVAGGSGLGAQPLPPAPDEDGESCEEE